MNKKKAASLAKSLAIMCVRNNTSLESWHAGYYPASKTGDYSDVKVIDAEGSEIPWNELSRLDDLEMKRFMKEIVNNLYSYLLLSEKSNFNLFIDYFTSSEAAKWDEPEVKLSWIDALATDF